ncbi:helix-turn-helix domain-containing protein [Pedobacter cryotolerans]|uniref:LuxR family transcriptional regulator n=1 Tax=Pedobacter cryotolerans TaxID=2571270 RepID=A0A4U1C6R1_9SPHI|nr:helix-turn-helix transcriptional regulator [Pedobacter cryotolerans]TKC00022.1 LuxR family transcriptional regulator [Pedobacter cryotolerans]
MMVFGSELHVLTMVCCLLEFGMCCYQLIYYLSFPQERRRFWYLWLLILLVFYNITGGLFPDPKIDMPIRLQNIIAYGSGFLMASYFPFYFYKAFNLKRLRFHAIYGVQFFLLLPYVIFFIIIYSRNGDLEFARSYGMIVPAIYSVVIFFAMLNAIRLKINGRKKSPYPYRIIDMVLVYAAVSPWVFMSAFAYFNVAQWIEVLMTNIGFLIITILFIARSVRQSRMEMSERLSKKQDWEELFGNHCETYRLSKREREIALLLCKGMTYRDIAGALFISERTVDNHVQRIFLKTEVNKKMDLQKKLGFVHLI